jgi:hypothetical protein
MSRATATGRREQGSVAPLAAFGVALRYLNHRSRLFGTRPTRQASS